MLFGVYLVENGVLTCEEFFEALKLQLRSRPQLGALAIELRMLSAKQVFAVLRSQCDAPDDMFGELAVTMGFLTPAELGQLVYEQQLRMRQFGDLLIEAGMLSPEAVAMHLQDFRRSMEHVAAPALIAVDG